MQPFEDKFADVFSFLLGLAVDVYRVGYLVSSNREQSSTDCIGEYAVGQER